MIQKACEAHLLKYNKGSGTLRIIALINDTAMPSVDASSMDPKKMARPTGFEPVTPAFGGRHFACK